MIFGHIDVLLAVSAISMYFFTIYIIPFHIKLYFHIGSCKPTYTDCCTDTRCEVGDCNCDSSCYEAGNLDCCTDAPQICDPRK